MEVAYGPWGLAMAPPPGGGGASSQSPAFMIGWLVLMMAIFWVLLVRPQQRREKERREMLAKVKSGDRVVFSGILGTVTNVKEKTFTVKIADNVKVEILRGAVTQVLGKGEAPTEDTAGS